MNPQSAIRNSQSEDSGPFGHIRLPSAESPCELPLDTLPRPADWAAVYGRTAPLAVEIGCGGGRTLINMALARPEWNFMGIERAGEYYRMLRDRVAKRKMQNL